MRRREFMVLVGAAAEVQRDSSIFPTPLVAAANLATHTIAVADAVASNLARCWECKRR
jgi:hypothetical protein